MGIDALKMRLTRQTRDGFDILNPKTGQRTKADLDTLHSAIAHHVAWHSVELLLLFWVQQLADILHGCDMG